MIEELTVPAVLLAVQEVHSVGRVKGLHLYHLSQGLLRTIDLCLNSRLVGVADELSQFIEDGVLQLFLVHAQILQLE